MRSTVQARAESIVGTASVKNISWTKGPMKQGQSLLWKWAGVAWHCSSMAGAPEVFDLEWVKWVKDSEEVPESMS